MDPPSTATIAKIWADAPLLTKFVRERAERLAGETLAGAVPPRDIQSSSTMERLLFYSQFQTNLMAARDPAMRDTANDLVAGRLVGLGRASGSYVIEVIDPSCWIGAEFDGDSATRDNKKIIEIHIAKPEVVPSLQTRLQPGSGRPSKAAVIRAAIAEYAKTDPGLDRPRLGRFRHYRDFITAQGFDLRNDDGFGDKTLEKYENEHRKKFK